LSLAGLGDHLPALGIKSLIERQRSMAVVFKAVSFGATGRSGRSDPGVELHSFRQHRTLRRSVLA
jgi:hypothetical protein